MAARVFGLETEYAVSFVSEEGDTPGPGILYEVLYRLVGGMGSSVGSGFLPNGSRFYLDQRHPEWATPECRTAREAATFDDAATSLLLDCRTAAEAELARRGHVGRLLIVKNNVDGSGNTYGCHENYMTPRHTEWLNEEDHLRLTARGLVPFLVTRQVIAGTGRVGWGMKSQEGAGFQLAQRLDFLSEVVSPQTTSNRAIFSLSREKESLASDDHRRLHLILGDSNLSPWATWLKLGTTALVLRLIEELGLSDIPHLSDPLGAIRAISRDPTCSVAVPLRDGRHLTGVEIQALYWQQAEAHLAGRASAEERMILDEWGQALDDLEHDPRALYGLVDWVTKKRVLDLFLQQRGLTWEAVTPGSETYFDLARMDIQFHELSPEGLHQRLRGTLPASPLKGEEVAKAQQEPPAFTRAWLRGLLLRHLEGRIGWKNWDRAVLDGKDISVSDPFSLELPAALANLLPSACQARRLELALGSPDPEIRAWAVTRGTAAAVRQIAADRNEDREVRLAALETLARQGGEAHLEVLRSLIVPDEDTAVRRRAEELLQSDRSAERWREEDTAVHVSLAEPTPAPADNPLVQLLD